MKWIDTSENLPEFDVPVLVFGEGQVFWARLSEKTQTKDFVYLSFLEGAFSCERVWVKVSHWMPLPSPPKQ